MRYAVSAWFAILLAVGSATPVAAQSVGGGLSFWVPESLYLGLGGTVGVESTIGTSIGLGSRFSLPVGIAYDKVFGLLPEAESIGAASAPWFISDSLLGTVMAKIHLPAGPLYVDVFGGLAGVWNMSISVLTGAMQTDLAGAGQTLAFTTAPTLDGGRFGWGWQAGGAIGLSFGQVNADINVTYRLIKSPGTLTGTYLTVQNDGTAVSGPSAYGPEAITIRMAGFSVGIDVGFSM